MPLWPLEWSLSAPKRTCRLAPRRLPGDSQGICLQGKPGMRLSPLALSRGGPVGFERMIGTWFQSEQEGDPSLVHSIQLHALVRRRLWPPRYQGTGDRIALVRNNGRRVRPVDQAGVLFHNQAGTSPWLWSTLNFSQDSSR
jgi:hypothetical protein